MIFQLENVSAEQGGVQALTVPALEVAQGQTLAVVGPNGSGKTTLLLCLAGLLEATGGRLIYRGRGVSDGSGRANLRRSVTMVFQEPLLFNSTVSANIGYGLRLRGMEKLERRSRVEEAASLFGITHLLDRSARKLSGGEQQRVSLARAFAVRPDLILMDEPFSALDAPTRQPLLDDLGRILHETNTTAIFSTHDLSDAIHLATHIAVLNGGRLVQRGTLKDVLQNPRDPFIAALVASVKSTAERMLGSFQSP
jgi:tungstate transport system ATP-binding protein